MYFTVPEIDAGALADSLQAESQLRVIDVRELREVAAGTVPGAEAMPLHTVSLHLHDLPRDEKLVLICRSGARSAQACAFLQQRGFDNVINLRGGLIAWTRSGFPLQLPEAQAV